MFSQRISLSLALCVLYALGAAAVDCKKIPKKIDLHQCCPMPDWITPEIETKCSQHIKNKAAGQGGSSLERLKPCFMPCFLNETGIYVDSTLHQDKVDAYFGEILADKPDFMPITKAAFEMCVVEQQELKAKWQEMRGKWQEKHSKTKGPSTNEGMANRRLRHECFAGMHIGGCVFRETFTNCPAAEWQDSEECNEVRDYMRSCKFMWKGRGKHPNSEETHETEEV